MQEQAKQANSNLLKAENSNNSENKLVDDDVFGYVLMKVK